MPVITLDIVVSNLSDVLQLFDRIEVHRSTTGSSGTYSEITNLNSPTSATLDGTTPGTFTLNGLTLAFQLDLGTDPVSVTFEGTDPIDLQTVINQINAVVPGVASEVPTNTNRLRLTSPTSGTASEILVTSGSAATALGLPTTKVNGKERRLRLVDPTIFYKFYDKDGDDTYWYKTRYSISTGPLTSSFSSPRQGNIFKVVDDTQLVTGTLALTNGMGGPVIGRRIIFVPMTRIAVGGGSAYNVVPGLDARVEVLTDPAGTVSVPLIRGVTYRVAFEGTNYMREFVAPTDSGVLTFDIFSLIGTAPDPFDIVQAPPRPIKMS
jgi:hypothetical protein